MRSRFRSRRLTLGVALFLSVKMLATACMAQPRSLVVSYQPASYNAMPLLAATAARVWERLGLAVTLASFPSANAQLGAAGLETWDVGIIGPVAGIAGAARHGLMVIALTDDEAPGHVLLIRPTADPSQLRGMRLAAMGNSPAWLTLAGCLARSGVRIADARVSSSAPATAIADFRAQRIDGLVLGFPAAQNLVERNEAQAICSGRDTGLVMPGVIVARAQLARNDAALLARFVAGYLYAASDLRAEREQAVTVIGNAYRDADEAASATAIRAQLEQRRYFALPDQLRLMRFAGPRSPAAEVFTRLGESVGTSTGLGPVPHPLAYLSDLPLRALEADAALIRFLERR